MTIQDLGSLGELLAAVATLATLGYLAVQVGQARRQLRVLANLAGHSDIRSIQKYSKIQPGVLRSALSKLPRGGHVGAGKKEAQRHARKSPIPRRNRSSKMVEAAGIEPDDDEPNAPEHSGSSS